MATAEFSKFADILSAYRFKWLLIREGGDEEKREEQQRNNRAALGQGPGFTSRDTYNIQLVFITANYIPLGFQIFCLKNDTMISGGFWGKPFNIIVIQVYAPVTNGKRLMLNSSIKTYIPSWTNTQKRCPFHRIRWEYKSRKSLHTWSNTKVWPWSTKWSRERLTEFCQENTLFITNTLFQQHKRQLYTWTSPDGQYQNQIDYILCSHRWRTFIQSVKNKKDHELTVAQIMKSLQNSDLNLRK